LGDIVGKDGGDAVEVGVDAEGAVAARVGSADGKGASAETELAGDAAALVEELMLPGCIEVGEMQMPSSLKE
jgi:hypothetical protein